MKKIIKWFKQSNRYKHFLYGIIAGAFADSWYSTEYTGIGVAGALELKDVLYGGKFDIVDFILTVIGFNIGYSIKLLIKLWMGL